MPCVCVLEHYSLCKIRREALVRAFIHQRYEVIARASVCKHLGLAGLRLPSVADIMDFLESEHESASSTQAPPSRAPTKSACRKRARATSSATTEVRRCKNLMKRKRCLSKFSDTEPCFSEENAPYCDACLAGFGGSGSYTVKRAKLFDASAH